MEDSRSKIQDSRFKIQVCHVRSILPVFSVLDYGLKDYFLVMAQKYEYFRFTEQETGEGTCNNKYREFLVVS